MKETPILFSGEMVRAILDGRKTQTRRIIMPQPFGGLRESAFSPSGLEDPHGYSIRPKYYIGDRLWVRETWADTNGENGPMISYKAGGERFLVDESYPVDYGRYPGAKFTMWCGDLYRGESGHNWISAMHMPRWASRITLEVTGVRAQRIQDISEADAKAEGFACVTKDDGRTYKYGIPDLDGLPGNDDYGWPWSDWNKDPRQAMQKLWNSIYPGSWERNDWVFAYTFTRDEV